MKRGTVISIIALLVLAGVWYYVKNYTKLLSSNTLYYAFYDDVKGMQESSTVYLKGVKVGKVKTIDLHTDQKLKVTFAINENLRLPVGTAAIIGVGDFTGNKSVHLEAGPGPGMLLPNGTLVAGFDTTMIENFDAKISPVLHNGKVLLRNVDSGLNSFNSIINKGLGAQTQEDIERFNKVLGNFSRVTGKANMCIQQLHPTITNLDSTLSKHENINSGLNSSLASSEKKTSETAKKQMHLDLEETRTSVNKLMTSFRNLSKNKLFSDTVSYSNTTLGLDTFNQSMQTYQKDPPSPIKIFSSKKK